LNPPKCCDLDYIHFLMAAANVFTCTEAARCYPEGSDSPSHDAFTRLLQRWPPDTEELWIESSHLVRPGEGILIVDDTTLDKPYAKKMDLVYQQYSGKHHSVVNGINITTLVWTDGNSVIPVDFRIYDNYNDGKTKNDHLQDMLEKAKERGFRPDFVLFDSWYSSLDNLKKIRGHGWHWLTRLKKNRLVNPDNTKNVQISTIDIPSDGRNVHLKGYGFVKVFRIVSKDGDEEHWATDLIDMEEPDRKELARKSWKIEEYHRGIKQFCGVERCQARNGKSQRTHILFSIRAFLRLEVERIRTTRSWFESKQSVIRNAIKEYIKYLNYNVSATLTA
jgi:putative transposase